MAGPAWLDRLERRHSAPLFYTSVSLLAILDGAALSGLAGRWLVLPGLAVALGLLWLVAVHTDQRLVLTLLFFLSAAALFVNSTCELLVNDGTGVAGPAGGCRDAQPGEHVRVFHDPAGEVPSSWSAPHPTRWIWTAVGADVVFTACALRAAVIGVRGNRQADSQRSGTPGGRPFPSPPQAPPAPR